MKNNKITLKQYFSIIRTIQDLHDKSEFVASKILCDFLFSSNLKVSK